MSGVGGTPHRCEPPDCWIVAIRFSRGRHRDGAIHFEAPVIYCGSIPTALIIRAYFSMSSLI